MFLNASIGNPAVVFGGAQFMSVPHMRPFIDSDGASKVVVNGEKLYANAPALLQYDEWKDIDRRVIEVFTDRLVGIADLIGAGLTHPLGGLGVTIAQWELVSDMSPAGLDMSGVTPGEEDTPAFDLAGTPVPIIHKDFRINIRRLLASRRMGEGVDVISSDLAARVVAEKCEDILFHGATLQVDGMSLVGYTTFPNRNTVGPFESWNSTAALVPGSQILSNVQAMLDAARADNVFGPFVLYIPKKYEGRMDDDYNPGTSDTRTIRQRILQLPAIQRIQVADRLAPASNQHAVLLVPLRRETVDLAIGQDLTTVSWQMYGGMQERYKVMTAQAPRIKSDFDGRCGIVHADTSTTPA